MDANKLLEKLRRKISSRDTIRRGEISRVAEALKCSPSTVHRWFFGNSEPRKAMRTKILALVNG